MYIQDTIAAIATPIGQGAVGVVRLSGLKSKEILSKIFHGKTNVQNFQSHHLYFGGLADPVTGDRLDDALVVWMQSPHSFTGEEVVEVQTHGNPLLQTQLLNVLTRLGARLAEPGEFTKRAFLNGKMDLAQAEGVASLISSENEWALKNSLAQMGGTLSRIISQLRADVTHALSLIEVGFDFGEEDIEFLGRSQIQDLVQKLKDEIKRLLDTFQTGQIYRDGVRVALIGKPNVGKSSLLNAIVEEERAITHHEPGTTRDVICGERKIAGIPFHFFDTAGVREAHHPVEQEGIRRSQDVLEKADIVCLLLDLSRPLEKEDQELLRAALKKKVLVIGTKRDLPAQWDLKDIPKEWPHIKVSSQSREGIPEFLGYLESYLTHSGANNVHNYVLNNVRHKEALESIQIKLEGLSQHLKSASFKDDQISQELREITNLLGAITGEISSENILDEIFSRFCIGK